MPTPSEASVETREGSISVAPDNLVSVKQKEVSSASESDAASNHDGSHKHKQNHHSNLQSFNGRRFNPRSTNGNQNGNRQNRNTSVNKRSNGDANNNQNSHNGNKQYNFKTLSAPQQKIMQSDYHQHQKTSNGHVDQSKKNAQKYTRSITKSGPVGRYHESSSRNSPPVESPASISPVFDAMNGAGDSINMHPPTSQHNQKDADGFNRKYSVDFLHQVGYKMSNSPGMAQNSPKFTKPLDDAKLSALKMALGDNSDYYTHFYASSMYGNPNIIQQQQQQQLQQNFNSRFQQNQNQVQQRMQRMYHRGQVENYHRLYQQQVYNEIETPVLSCQCPPNVQLHYQRSGGYQQAYNSPSYQNRNKTDRSNFQNNKKTRQGTNHVGFSYQNGNNDRNFKKDNNRSGPIGKSHSFNEEISYNRVSQPFQRSNTNEPAFRSLSPTPPSSSKSSSPGAVDKCIEKDLPRSNGSSSELADDSASTASASSSSGPSGLASFVSDMKNSLSAPILMIPEEPTKNINLWINNNFHGGALHSGLSLSAEHINLNYRETPITIIKRPASSIVAIKKPLQGDQTVVRDVKTTYDLQKPFEYYLTRTDGSETRRPPVSFQKPSKWDQLSDDMWERFQLHQQSRLTYQKKMLLWRDLYDSLKTFPLFQQKAFPKWGLYLVGSTISGFGLDSSDIDMCLVSKGNFTDSRVDPRMEAMVTLNELKNYLISTKSPFINFSLINAKVPILRFRDSSNTIEIDLNYNNCVGVRNTHLLYSYSQLDWRLRPLALTVKLWAQFHNINDARNSTISSYSLVLMVIHFLQSAVKPAILPCLHKLCPDKFLILHDISTIDMVEQCEVNWRSENTQPLGELFCRFLDYYSNFDYAKNAISIRTGGVLPIEECKSARSAKNDPNHWLTLCIEEPFDLTNTARSAYDVEIFARIKDVFFQSWYRLKESCDLHSVFRDPIFVSQQQQYMSQISQMKFMIPGGSGPPVMAPVNDVKS